jgi:hypothetical protein
VLYGLFTKSSKDIIHSSSSYGKIGDRRFNLEPNLQQLLRPKSIRFNHSYVIIEFFKFSFSKVIFWKFKTKKNGCKERERIKL